MGTWVHGYMGTWVHGYMGTWVHGYMGTWVHGYMGTWVHGYMGTWVRVPLALKSENPKPRVASAGIAKRNQFIGASSGTEPP